MSAKAERSARQYLGWMPPVLILAAIFASPLAAAADAAEQRALAGWLERQVELATWSANVIQTRKLKSLLRPLVAEGRVWISQPQRFRWQLGDPARTLAVGTPTGLLVAYPRLRQLERYDYEDTKDPALQQVLDLLEVGFPSSTTAFHERYELLSGEQANDRWRFELQPRSEQSRRILERIYIEAAADDLSLLATELLFPDGSTMRNEFRDVQVNMELESSLFELDLPDDWDMTEPLNPTIG